MNEPHHRVAYFLGPFVAVGVMLFLYWLAEKIMFP